MEDRAHVPDWMRRKMQRFKHDRDKDMDLWARHVMFLEAW